MSTHLTITGTLPEGTRLGEFELVRVIGEGGFGIVYLAWDHSLERAVALKEYMPANLASRADGFTVGPRSERHRETFEAGLRSFVNEARLLARFDHPALVKVFRFWEAHGTACMVMPFYEAGTLLSAVRALPAPPDEAWLRRLLDPLCDALAMLHAARCYHRDISPDNILLLPPDDRPLLLDFGAARRVIGGMTHSLTSILKPGYAPIEQYAEVPGLRQGPATDVYALAATVHWMITGRTPPPAVARMLDDTCEPLAVAAAGRYSPSFLRALDRALVVRPELRTPDIAAFREALFAVPPAAMPVPPFAETPLPDAASGARPADGDATVAMPAPEDRTTAAPATAAALADPSADPPAAALLPNDTPQRIDVPGAAQASGAAGASDPAIPAGRTRPSRPARSARDAVRPRAPVTTRPRAPVTLAASVAALSAVAALAWTLLPEGDPAFTPVEAVVAAPADGGIETILVTAPTAAGRAAPERPPSPGASAAPEPLPTPSSPRALPSRDAGSGPADGAPAPPTNPVPTGDPAVPGVPAQSAAPTPRPDATLAAVGPTPLALPPPTERPRAAAPHASPTPPRRTAEQAAEAVRRVECARLAKGGVFSGPSPDDLNRARRLGCR